MRVIQAGVVGFEGFVKTLVAHRQNADDSGRGHLPVLAFVACEVDGLDRSVLMCSTPLASKTWLTVIPRAEVPVLANRLPDVTDEPCVWLARLVALHEA